MFSSIVYVGIHSLHWEAQTRRQDKKNYGQQLIKEAFNSLTQLGNSA